MNCTFSLEQKSKTENLESKLIFHRYNIHLMSRFKDIETNFPKRKQKQTEQQLGYSDSTIRRCRDQINMPGPYNRKIAKTKKMCCQDIL